MYGDTVLSLRRVTGRNGGTITGTLTGAGLDFQIGSTRRRRERGCGRSQRGRAAGEYFWQSGAPRPSTAAFAGKPSGACERHRGRRNRVGSVLAITAAVPRCQPISPALHRLYWRTAPVAMPASSRSAIRQPRHARKAAPRGRRSTPASEILVVSDRGLSADRSRRCRAPAERLTLPWMTANSRRPIPSPTTVSGHNGEPAPAQCRPRSEVHSQSRQLDAAPRVTTATPALTTRG